MQIPAAIGGVCLGKQRAAILSKGCVSRFGVYKFAVVGLMNSG